jgi:hypothetical protein
MCLLQKKIQIYQNYCYITQLVISQLTHFHGFLVNFIINIKVGGIFHGALQYKNNPQSGDITIAESELITYDIKTPLILSIAITEYHTLVLFEDR